ncbi:hypothetical protein M0804_008151 [Polistes exclamans]|nr:hypothetical protein M0804_008151 [Polistes exclamans]
MTSLAWMRGVAAAFGESPIQLSTPNGLRSKRLASTKLGKRILLLSSSFLKYTYIHEKETFRDVDVDDDDDDNDNDDDEIKLEK